MGDSQTSYLIDLYYDKLKIVFGNRRNMQYYIEARRYNNWNNWLISLGYR